MSQIEYRRRLRERREKDNGNLSAFIPQAEADARTIARPTPVPVQAAPPPAVQSQVIAPASPAVPDIPVVPSPAPDPSPVVVPTAVNDSLTLQQLRDQAKQTAELLAGMPQAEYQSSLASLGANNPTLYAVVVDELNNMAAMQQDEGDGYDLSGLAGGEPSPSSDPTPAATVVDQGAQSPE